MRPRRQCAKCPWKVSTNPHDIPRGYSVEKHEALRKTIATDPLASILSKELHVMSCHDVHSLPCVGWLDNQLGPGNNLGLRVAYRQGKFGPFKTVGKQHPNFDATLPKELKSKAGKVEKDDMSSLSPETLDALRRWAKTHGRFWKSAMRRAWDSGIYPPDTDPADTTLLQHYRNAADGGSKHLDRLNLETEPVLAFRAGLLLLRKSRKTGTDVGLYCADEAGMESDPATPYVTVCEEHHTLVGHATRESARNCMSDPTLWCEPCQEKTP